MKKLLSILLALIFCLGIFVSCNNETQTESSSGIEHNKTEVVKYYYHRSYLERDSVRRERGVTVIETEDELNDFFDPKGINVFENENIEKMLSLNYILVIARAPLSYNEEIMGYRDIEIINDNGVIFVDILETYFDIEYNDGEIFYIEIMPEPSSSTDNVIYSTYYDVVLVPKDKVTINNNNISIVKIIHPIAD